ncbi:MAG: TIGR02186 family protein [Azospirillaceae bacterium]|nr:TIGR02186 family protein [Azospirillaceae bacterium]
MTTIPRSATPKGNGCQAIAANRFRRRLRDLAIGIGVSIAFVAGPAGAQALVADLSSHLIAITTGFTGAQVVLFGTVERQGDVAVVVEGPPHDVVVRRKDRMAGVWINSLALAFDQVPSFYSLATSRPLDLLVEPAVLTRHALDLDHLRLVPRTPVSPEKAAAFRAALIRNKQAAGLYSVAPNPVIFLGQRLFRTSLFFPANVPTGNYMISVYLLNDGNVVSAQTTPLVISKVGFSADIFDFAEHESILYGVASVIVAVALGWLAGVIFRKV